MVGPQLGRETDAIAESAYKIKRRLCVTTLHVILKSGRLEKWSGQSRTSRTGGAAPETAVTASFINEILALPAAESPGSVEPSRVRRSSLAIY